MGVDHGEGAGTSPPGIRSAEDANVNCLPDFVIYVQKEPSDVLWPSQYAKISFRPGPHWGAHVAPQGP